MRLNSLARIASCLLVVSCNQAAAPEVPDPGPTPVPASAAPDLVRSRETVAGVRVELTVSPGIVAPGDTVRLVATARNATRERLQIGIQCGPPMDISLATPTGQRRSALKDLLGGNGVFTCELGPQHFVEPEGTQITRIAWIAPSTRGEYVAVAGLRRGDGLGNVSEPIRFQVR